MRWISMVCLSLFGTSAWARGGSDGGGIGFLFLGIVGVAVTFGICYVIGEFIAPDARTENKLFAGFSVALLLTTLILMLIR